MPLLPGRHSVGPTDGTLRVQTYREGVAQTLGHDLVIDVEQWEGTVEVADDGAPTTIGLRADPRSMIVREGRRGVKPLTDGDREDIRSTIDRKILRGNPITFASSSVKLADGRLRVQGQLSIAGTGRPVTLELAVSEDGRVTGTIPVRQSDWDLKPYRAFMGVLKVRDDVEVVLDATVPTS